MELSHIICVNLRSSGSILLCSKRDSRSNLNLPRAFRAADQPESRSTKRMARQSKIGMVQRIEEFAAKLQPDPLGESKFPQERKISDSQPRGAYDSQSSIAELKGRG